MSVINISGVKSNGDTYPVEKIDAHVRAIPHQAVSIFVFCGDKLLLQRRALHKYHTGGLWANSCCTHPNWGESSADCANRRLTEELGIQTSLKAFGQIEYSASVGGGLWEHEYVKLFRGEIDREKEVRPNPAEVMDIAWRTRSALDAWVASEPNLFTPWLKIYLNQVDALTF